jgi:hypothetical protein
MRKKIIICSILCLLILAAGCAGVEKSTGYTEDKISRSYDAGRGESLPSPPAVTAGYASEPVSSVSRQKKESEESEQKIIRTASLSLEVPDVRKAAREIETVTTNNEGLIQSSSVYAGQNNQYSGTVTVRVPSGRFDTVLTQLNQYGRVLTTSTSATDVTEEYVDLVAQKNAFTTQLEQYNRILTKANNVSEILDVQKEIERVQVELDRIVGRMKYLDNRVSYSTITITLSEPAQVAASTGYSIVSVLNEGISGFIEMVTLIIIFFMTVLPLIIIGLLGYFGYRRWKRNQQV